MFAALTASIVLACAQPTVPPVDPCWDAYKARLKEIDRWQADCISAPIPGPTPCIDWPECCSTDAEQMRKDALIELLRCWGWLPPVEG